MHARVRRAHLERSTKRENTVRLLSALAGLLQHTLALDLIANLHNSSLNETSAMTRSANSSWANAQRKGAKRHINAHGNDAADDVGDGDGDGDGGPPRASLALATHFLHSTQESNKFSSLRRSEVALALLPLASLFRPGFGGRNNELWR